MIYLGNAYRYMPPTWGRLWDQNAIHLKLDPWRYISAKKKKLFPALCFTSSEVFAEKLNRRMERAVLFYGKERHTARPPLDVCLWVVVLQWLEGGKDENTAVAPSPLYLWWWRMCVSERVRDLLLNAYACEHGHLHLCYKSPNQRGRWNAAITIPRVKHKNTFLVFLKKNWIKSKVL